MAFCSLARIWGECSIIHSPPARSFYVFFFVCLFVVVLEISSRTLILLFRPGSVHSSSAIWDDCDREFLDELRVSSFPWWVPIPCLDSVWPAHSNFATSRMYACIRCILPFFFPHNNVDIRFRGSDFTVLPPAPSSAWQGSFACVCGNTGTQWIMIITMKYLLSANL